MRLRFKLNHLYQGQNAPFLYGVDAGLYAREGLDIEFVEGFSSSQVTRAIIADEADCGYGDLSSVLALALAQDNAPVRALMPIYQRSPCALGYLRPGPELDLQELDSQILCGPTGDTSARLLPILLRLNGLSHLSYDLLQVEPAERDAMIASGQVLAATCFDATLKFAMIMRGHDSSRLRFLYFADHGLDMYTGSLVCSSALLEAHSGLAAALRDATRQAWLSCYEEPELGVVAVVARAPHLDPLLVKAQLEWVMQRQIFPRGPTDMAFDRDSQRMKNTLDCVLALGDTGKTSRPELIEEVLSS